MHRTHNNHYHKHRYNENYVAHPSLYESGENQERLACFHEDSGLEKSGTLTKEVSEQYTENATCPGPVTRDSSLKILIIIRIKYPQSGQYLQRL